MPDHGPLCLRSPPKYSVATPVGWLTGKSASRMPRECLGRERHCTGLPFWARGACVRTVGLAAQVIRAYGRNQEREEQRQAALHLQGLSSLSRRQEGLAALA
jgi:putative transposase